MGAFTNYKREELIKAFYSEETPDKLYFGYSTGVMDKDGVGRVEPAGATGYARTEIDNDGSFWSGPTTDEFDVSSITNAEIVTCPLATQNQGVVEAVFIADHLTAGNILAIDNLDKTGSGGADKRQEVREGNRLVFEPGEVVLTIT